MPNFIAYIWMHVVYLPKVVCSAQHCLVLWYGACCYVENPWLLMPPCVEKAMPEGNLWMVHQEKVKPDLFLHHHHFQDLYLWQNPAGWTFSVTSSNERHVIYVIYRWSIHSLSWKEELAYSSALANFSS
jgi:hypothetical protein